MKRALKRLSQLQGLVEGLHNRNPKETPVVVLTEPYFTLQLNHLRAQKALNVYMDDRTEYPFTVKGIEAKIVLEGRRMSASDMWKYRYKGRNML